MISSNDNCFDKHTFDDWSVAVDPFIPPLTVVFVFATVSFELFPVTEHSNGMVSVQPGVWFTSSLILKLLSNWLSFLLVFKLLSLFFCCGIIIGLMLGKRYRMYQFWKKEKKNSLYWIELRRSVVNHEKVNWNTKECTETVFTETQRSAQKHKGVHCKER